MAKIKYIVSACLVGRNCSYDGLSRKIESIKELIDDGQAVAVCPEQLGSLPTPRPPSEIFAGDGEGVLRGEVFVFNKEGKDVTYNFIKGARQFLAIAKENKIKAAVLKANSPSCGAGKIYDGTFREKLTKGNGVTAALLLKNGIPILNEEQYQTKIKNAKSGKAKTKSKRK